MRSYLKISGNDIAFELMEAALGTVANTVMVCVQDVMRLDNDRGRMNLPGTSGGTNWRWRVGGNGGMDTLDREADRLKEMMTRYNRWSEVPDAPEDIDWDTNGAKKKKKKKAPMGTPGIDLVGVGSQVGSQVGRVGSSVVGVGAAVVETGGSTVGRVVQAVDWKGVVNRIPVVSRYIKWSSEEADVEEAAGEVVTVAEEVAVEAAAADIVENPEATTTTTTTTTTEEMGAGEGGGGPAPVPPAEE